MISLSWRDFANPTSTHADYFFNCRSVSKSPHLDTLLQVLCQAGFRNGQEIRSF
jgi:hypothetical protein